MIASGTYIEGYWTGHRDGENHAHSNIGFFLNKEYEFVGAHAHTAYKVMAVFFDDDDANEYMANHPDASVLCDCGAIVIVDKNDLGRKTDGRK